MKAEKQYKEAASRVIQPRKDCGGHIVDNRPKAIDQTRIIGSIQEKKDIIQKMPNQTLITDYYPVFTQFGNTFEASLTGGNVISHVEFEDFGDDEYEEYWLVDASTRQEYQRRGFARQLVANAVNYYGVVFASLATQQEHEDYDDSDTRYLTHEGAALVNSCIRHGINIVYRHPFYHESHSESDDA